MYLGAAFLVGGVFTRMYLIPQHPRLWVLGIGLVLLGFGAAWNITATLSQLGALTGPNVLNYLMQVASGRAILTMLLGGCLLLAAELNRFSIFLRVAATVLTIWGLAGIGHGSSHGTFVHVLHTVHGLAMCLWLGGVLALLSSKTPTARDAQRFSPVALASVLTLVITGALITLKHTEDLLSLPQSEYGRTLIIKWVVFAVLILAVMLVRRAFGQSNLGQLKDEQLKHVRLFLLAETLLLFSVLGVTAHLVQLAPPSHLAQHSQ